MFVEPNGFALDPRDQFILSQALCIAAKFMQTAEHPEHSNIADMERLIEEQFPVYRVVQEVNENMAKLGGALNTCEDDCECGTTE
mgnify:CR=1 FL=1